MESSVHCAGSDDPKMFELNLRILGDVDTAQKKYLYDEQDLELKCSHPCLFPVIGNVKAMLLFPENLKGDIAIRELEKIHEQYPANINTMENLEAMYRKKRYRKKADDMFKKLKEQIEEQDTLELARYDLEKAYILLIDLHAETRKTTAMLLQEAYKQLRNEVLHSRGPQSALQRRAMTSLKSAFQNTQQAQKSLIAVQTSCTVETTRGRELAETFFVQGLSKMEHLAEKDKHIKREFQIWKHLYAKACNRIGSSSKSIMKTTEKKTYFRKSIVLFHEVISTLEESIKVDGEDIGTINCLVRSYAYIGHIIIMKNRIISSQTLEPPECIADTIWKDPWLTFRRGILLSREKKMKFDRVLLNRLALTLMNAEEEALQRGSSSRQIETVLETLPEVIMPTAFSRTFAGNFKMAESLCKLSLEAWPYPNWFAHFLLLRLYLKLYRIQYDEFQKKSEERTSSTTPDKTLLKMARKSGDEVLKLRSTTDTFLDVAECLFHQAIDPAVGHLKIGGMKEERKEEEKCIYEALDYLERAHDHHDCENHARKYALFGKCLFVVGEHEAGIEYMKTASMMEKSSRDPVYLRDICSFIAEFYQRSRDKTKWKLLFDMWLVIDENMRRYAHRIKYTLMGIANKYPHPVLDMIINIFDYGNKFGPRTKDIIDMCLQTLKIHNGKRVRKRAESVCNSLPEDIGRLIFSYQTRSPLINDTPSSDDEPALMSHDKPYDCYILYCSASHDWVTKVFLSLLKTSESNGVKYLLRSMTPGTREIIDKCFRVLVIIDDFFERDRHCNLELENLHKRCIDQGSGSTIIPIIRNDSGDVPDHLQVYTALDFTKPPYPMEKLGLVLHELSEE